MPRHTVAVAAATCMVIAEVFKHAKVPDCDSCTAKRFQENVHIVSSRFNLLWFSFQIYVSIKIKLRQMWKGLLCAVDCSD